jgi:hypothetical protein
VPYKTIVLHCNDKRRIARLLVPAVRLAETLQAHLVGLSIVPPIAVISAGAPEGMPIIVDDHGKLYSRRKSRHEVRVRECDARSRLRQ